MQKYSRTLKTLLLALCLLVLHTGLFAQGGIEKVHMMLPEAANKNCLEGDCENGAGKAEYEINSAFTVSPGKATYSGEFKNGRPFGKGMAVLAWNLKKIRIITIQGTFDGWLCDGHALYGYHNPKTNKPDYTYQCKGKNFLGAPRKGATLSIFGKWEPTVEIIETAPKLFDKIKDKVKLSYADGSYFVGSPNLYMVGIPGYPGIFYGKDFQATLKDKALVSTEKKPSKLEYDWYYNGAINWNNGDKFEGVFKFTFGMLALNGIKVTPHDGMITHTTGGVTKTEKIDTRGFRALQRRAHCETGQSFFAKQRFKEAIAEYEACGVTGLEQQGWLELASAYAFTKQPDKALESLDSGISIYSEYSELYFFRAKIHSQKKDFAAATLDLDKGLALEPGNSEGIKLRMYHYFFSLKDYNATLQKGNESLKALRKSDTQTLSLIYYFQALAYQAKNEKSKAFSLLEKAVAADPGNLDARLNYAANLSQQGKFQQAINQIEPVLNAHGENVNVLFLAGEIYVAAGDKAKGCTMLKRAMKQLRKNRQKPTPAQLSLFRQLCR